MCFSKQAIEIVPNLKEKQTEIEKIILQQSHPLSVREVTIQPPTMNLELPIQNPVKLPKEPHAG